MHILHKLNQMVRFGLIPAYSTASTERGHDSVLVVDDRATKRVHFIATKKQLSSAETAQLLLDNVFRHHGIPNNIVSDRDIRFTARFSQTLNGKLGTSLFFSTTNHSSTN
ncbi:unnamed protein product [[Candida] boidinii]|nr:unnamed protein product [[Candida] boidinii]